MDSVQNLGLWLVEIKVANFNAPINVAEINVAGIFWICVYFMEH